MAKVRHFVAKKSGKNLLHYWQPSVELRAQGWISHRLSDDRAEALAKAESLNIELDAWRKGEVAPNAPPAAVKRGKKAAAGTVEALITDYKLSRWWTKLAPRTQKEYGWALDAIGAWAGDMQARVITGPAVEAFYQGQARRVEGSGRTRRVIDTPAKAHAAIRVLRLLLGAGERMGYLPKGSNPAAKPGISLRRQREPVLWSPEAVQQMAAIADRLGWRSIGTAILLNEWLGQREGDVLDLAPWTKAQGALVVLQGKTKRRVALPVHLVPHLVERLEGEVRRPGRVQSLKYLLIHEGTGGKWSEHTFRHVFADIRDAAAKGLGDLPAMPECAALRFMELRHTAVTRLHEAGVDELGIASITGHTVGSVRSILDKHYLIRTAKAAEGAFRKRLAAEGGEE